MTAFEWTVADQGTWWASGSAYPSDDEIVKDVHHTIKRIPGVLGTSVDKGFGVHTEVSSRKVRNKIYDAEIELMNRYPDTLFDFRVIIIDDE